MLWYEPIKNIDDELILVINQKLNDYKEAYENEKHTKNHLKAIIDICDQYIVQISHEQRQELRKEKNWKDDLSKNWLCLQQILEIQKNAVSRYFLPDAKNDELALWKLMINIRCHDKNKIKDIETKVMEREYWLEYRYKGNALIGDWINDNSLESYKEIIEDQSIRVNYKKTVKDYCVQFINGLMYYQDKKLDTKNAYNMNREVLYVMGQDGSIYLNKPNEETLTNFRHSSFFKGRSVICAGTMKVIEGEIQLITNNSGHYKPGKKHLINCLTILKDIHNVDLSLIKVKTHSKEGAQEISAELFDENYLNYIDIYFQQFKYQSYRNLLNSILKKIDNYDYIVRDDCELFDGKIYAKSVTKIKIYIQDSLNNHSIEFNTIENVRNLVYSALENEAEVMFDYINYTIEFDLDFNKNMTTNSCNDEIKNSTRIDKCITDLYSDILTIIDDEKNTFKEKIKESYLNKIKNPDSSEDINQTMHN